MSMVGHYFYCLWDFPHCSHLWADKATLTENIAITVPEEIDCRLS